MDEREIKESKERDTLCYTCQLCVNTTQYCETYKSRILTIYDYELEYLSQDDIVSLFSYPFFI